MYVIIGVLGVAHAMPCSAVERSMTVLLLLLECVLCMQFLHTVHNFQHICTDVSFHISPLSRMLSLFFFLHYVAITNQSIGFNFFAICKTNICCIYRITVSCL